ncbi:MAG: hypothetical protein RLN76_06810 [Phycisphaeraceae bacterium]
MSAKAKVSSGYRWRLIIIGLACIGWALYCAYDGFYAYPAQADEYAALQEFKEQYPEDWNTRWPDHALANDLAPDVAKIKNRTNFDIYTQYIMLAITGPLGLIFAFRAVTCGGWWVEVDDHGVRAHGNRSATWSQITDLDKTRWKKGIAYLKYQDDSGASGKILLDDWKYERDPTREIVEAIEQHLGHPTDDEDEASGNS